MASSNHFYIKISKRAAYGLACILIGGFITSVGTSFADDLRSTQTVLGSDLIMPYDGFLMVDSAPITGTRQIKFELYESASGGIAEWSESQTVTLYNGRFSVGLGSSTSLTSTLLDAEKLWLAMTIVDTDAQGNSVEIPLSGRQAIEPAPFAAWAGNSADMQVAGNLEVSNYASVGTTSQQARLDIEAEGNGVVTLKAGQLTVDSEDGAGLINLVAGALYNSGGNYEYLDTRGASRIRMNDGYISFFTGNLGSGDGQAAGDTVTFTEGLAIDASADTYVRNDLNVSGDTELDGAVAVDGNLAVDGNTTLGNSTSDTTTVTGDITVGGDELKIGSNGANAFYVNGSDQLYISPSLGHSGGVYVGNNFRVNYDTTLGSSSAYDTTVSGDLTVNGDITNFSVTSYLSHANGSSITMVDSTNSICFLTRFRTRRHHDSGDDEADCDITDDGSNWILDVKQGGKALPICSARCLSW